MRKWPLGKNDQKKTYLREARVLIGIVEGSMPQTNKESPSLTTAPSSKKFRAKVGR